MALKPVFNPITGNLDYINDSVSGTVREYKVDIITLDASDITAEQITLDEIPSIPSEVRLTVIGGIEQENGVDFSVTGNTLSWGTLGLDGILAIGDKLIITYS